MRPNLGFSGSVQYFQVKAHLPEINSPPISSTKTSSPAVRCPSSSVHLFPNQPDLVGKSFCGTTSYYQKLFISACYWLQAINLLEILKDCHLCFVFCFQPAMLKSLALIDYNEDHIKLVEIMGKQNEQPGY